MATVHYDPHCRDDYDDSGARYADDPSVSVVDVHSYGGDLNWHTSNVQRIVDTYGPDRKFFIGEYGESGAIGTSINTSSISRAWLLNDWCEETYGNRFLGICVHGQSLAAKLPEWRFAWWA